MRDMDAEAGKRLGGAFRFLYYDGEENRCPGCGGKHWTIGRLMAECAYCETALPLQSAHGYGYTMRIFGHGAPGYEPDGSELAAMH